MPAEMMAGKLTSSSAIYFFSFPILRAISAINLGFKSASTLSTMFAISLASSPVAEEPSG
jgi:hypothetical protein